jgi:hypothetical protein
MTLNEFATALRLASEHNLDATDILLMDRVAQADENNPDASTIMQVVAASGAACRAKSHARITKLCKRGLLRKVEHPSGDLRYKRLEFGPAFLNLQRALREL